MTRRIVITGPESTGKSFITAHLADRLGVPYASEYARFYLEENGPDYTYDQLLEMSRGHREYQKRHVPKNAALGIFDTDLVNYKIWCEVVFGECHPEIVDAMREESGHRYILCYPDLPWEEDPLRENPHDREMLFERHREEIEKLGRPYRVIRGQALERFKAAEQAALSLLE